MLIKIPLVPINIKVERVVQESRESPEKDYAKIIKRDYNKIFCVGFWKTGTSSLEQLLLKFGFVVGNQSVAEILAEDWAVHRRDERIIKYCYTADAFQDMPFMFPDLYKVLDEAFPNSKFILTVRDTADQWFNSLCKFHIMKFSSAANRPPNEEDKRNAIYRYKGFIYDTSVFFWDYPKIPLYDELAYKGKYSDHNNQVRNYFKNRDDQFIEINVAKVEDFNRLCSFLHVNTNIKNFPWENKTDK